jgi:hypothetical protein
MTAALADGLTNTQRAQRFDIAHANRQRYFVAQFHQPMQVIGHHNKSQGLGMLKPLLIAQHANQCSGVEKIIKHRHPVLGHGGQNVNLA